VLVLSAVRFYRDGLAQLLAAQGVEVVGVSAYDLQALEVALKQTPDVVLVDISSREGMTALRAFAERAPGIRTVALAVSDSDYEVLECAEAAVAGYVTRDASLEELVATLTSVASGELRCPPLVAGILRRRLAALASQEAKTVDTELTLREFEIVRLIAHCLSNKEIAGRLNIEVSTVKSHVHSILEKLHVRRRAEAVARLRSRTRRRTEPFETVITDRSHDGALE
jgi:DNA-binding NarL/FixJ family response regulator